MSNPTQVQPKRIPYGVADYGRLRRENAYYVDKTHYIPRIEAAPFYLFCIRPRRFGKSLWLSVLQHYYDVNQADNFDFLFGETYIGKHPTADRNSYLILFFNFALVNPAVDEVQRSFEENGRVVIQDFLIRYQRFFAEEERQEILQKQKVEDKLRLLFLYAHRQQLKIYLFIDEYDNFANTILTTDGQDAYHELTHGGGFFRYFFNLLKGATGGQIAGLTRLFITGVSPVTMDDVTSGFNIGANISTDSRFNEMIGFTEAEVQTVLHDYQSYGRLPLGVEPSLGLMQVWYNNYRFGQRAETSMYNSDMVLYFLLRTDADDGVPLDLIDQNIRIDYGKLRHLMAIDRRLNGNFSVLKTIVEEGETVSPINASFPLEQLLNRENFISLLYYFGLLSMAGTRDGSPLLRIPNRTVKDLMYGYLRSAYADVNIFKLDVWRLSRLLDDMAYRGDWQPFFDYLNEQIRQQASVRDHLHGEKVIQGFLIAYLNVTHNFLTWSEREMGGGFVDLYLEPFLARYPEIKYGYLIELEHISETQFNKKGFDQSLAAEKAEAEGQLRQYANDTRIQQVAQQVTVKKLVLIYKGWELVYAAEV
ncbi:MAG: AAA family ATPase [Caldilineaceae bacterium]|nr:AAA family ATPase [Caldilineaceae bacterium]